MNISQHLIEALESLRTNKLRSALTILGIVIGVAAVIAMMAIGRGAQEQITKQIQSLGTNLIYVTQGARNIRNPRPLTTLDAEALRDPDLSPSVANVAPIMQGRNEVTAAGQVFTVPVSAITPEMQEIRNMAVTEGELLNDSHVSGRQAVAVIGPTTALNFFSRTEEVVGLTLRIGQQSFRVIGLLEAKGGSELSSQDDTILIPITTGQLRLFRRPINGMVDQVIVQAVSAEAVQSASDEVSDILRTRHKVQVGRDDFTIRTQQEMLTSVNSITGTMTAFLGGIAAISLLVGGIGIMNIMLVSVSERTREIGLRKALGARRANILTQFLIESSVLSLVGGIIGIMLAAGISQLVAYLTARSGNALTPVIGIDAILMATVFSAAVGLFFGIYPANRASMLEPVEALRSE